MSLFEDRERAFERQFVHGRDLRFRAEARRNRRLAEWAHGRMSAPGHEIASYAEFIVRLGAFYGDEGVRERILHDLEMAGAPASHHRVARLMEEMLAEELLASGPPRPRRASQSH